MQPYGVIFDMDGVLIDSYHAHFESWRDMASERGIEFTEEDFASTFGRTTREIIVATWGEHCFSEDEILEMDAEKEEIFRRIIADDFPEMAGVSTLVESLHEAGFRLAIGSSGPPENVETAIESLDCGQRFQSVVTGRDVMRGKPNPEVFLKAAERLGVAPERCVVVEDATPGVRAARAAGMRCVGLLSTGHQPHELELADRIVESLEDLSATSFAELLSL